MSRDGKISKIVEALAKRGLGATVTQRAKSVKQPYGGYIKRTDFEETALGAGEEELEDGSNIDPSLVGIAVDYLTRYILTDDVFESFKTCILGAAIVKETEAAAFLLSILDGLDDKSIESAVKLAGFDSAYRAGPIAYVPVKDINPNEAAIKNIRLLVTRSVKFFQDHGPLTSCGFDFKGAYTKTIASGDADYLTEDTLWDLKVLKNNFNKNHTLQLMIYWRMGLRSDPAAFKDIKYLGIYNPRKNKVYRFALDNLSDEMIKEVDRDVIGYDVD